jgi:hypothetical protein
VALAPLALTWHRWWSGVTAGLAAQWLCTARRLDEMTSICRNRVEKRPKKPPEANLSDPRRHFRGPLQDNHSTVPSMHLESQTE